MSRFDDEDFENDTVPVKSPFYDSQNTGENFNDDNYLLNSVAKLSKLHKSLQQSNISEALNNSKRTLDYIGQTFLLSRLENGLKGEELKRMLISRIGEIMTSFSPQELTNLFDVLSRAGVPDLDRLFGNGSQGININMQGPTTNHNIYDNSVNNTQINQTANLNYANDKALEKIEPETVKKMGKISEAKNIFASLNIPRQNQVEYKPEEKFITQQEKDKTLIEANFEEIKQEEKHLLNED